MKLEEALFIAAAAVGLNYVIKQQAPTTGGGGPPPPTGNLVTVTASVSSGTNVSMIMTNVSAQPLPLVFYMVAYNRIGQVKKSLSGPVGTVQPGKIATSSQAFGDLPPDTYTIRCFATSGGASVSNTASVSLLVFGGAGAPSPNPPFYQLVTVAGIATFKVQLAPPGNVQAFVTNWQRQGYQVSLGGYVDAQGNPTSGS